MWRQARLKSGAVQIKGKPRIQKTKSCNEHAGDQAGTKAHQTKLTRATGNTWTLYRRRGRWTRSRWSQSGRGRQSQWREDGMRNRGLREVNAGVLHGMMYLGSPTECSMSYNCRFTVVSGRKCCIIWCRLSLRELCSAVCVLQGVGVGVFSIINPSANYYPRTDLNLLDHFVKSLLVSCRDADDGWASAGCHFILILWTNLMTD